MFTDSRRKRRRKNRLMTVGIIGMVLAMIVYGYNMSRAQVREQAAAQTPTPRVSVMLPSASPQHSRDGGFAAGSFGTRHRGPEDKIPRVQGTRRIRS